jgi:ferrochelatase
MAVVTPAFVSNCLETLEEIGMEAKHSFIENGGEDFNMIPCLNDDDKWVQTLSGWIKDWAKTK